MIIKNYIHKDLLHKLAWIIGLLILIFASNKFVGFLSDAAEGNLPADMVFMMLGYKILASLPKIFPISILMAVLIKQIIVSPLMSNCKIILLTK